MNTLTESYTQRIPFGLLELADITEVYEYKTGKGMRYIRWIAEKSNKSDD